MVPRVVQFLVKKNKMLHETEIIVKKVYNGRPLIFYLLF